ncbi:MAG: hypothetical protein EP329_28250 [Deltaproteobacteria bacterium]|nr:MAG: hypothetical protein EP329_28250 [Deltaproteobacteria bacterium]
MNRWIALGVSTLIASATLAALGPVAHAEPWAPRPFRILPEEPGKDPVFVVVHPEYRVRFTGIDPLELNGTVAQGVRWADQRLRLESSVGLRGVGAIHVQADVLDGVLFGDNGEFGRAPEPTSGLGIASRQANLAGWTVGLLPGADPVQVDSYGPVLRAVAPIEINYLYGEVLLPIGVLRIGRQPINEGGTVSLNDGLSGRNTWGASFYHESADRVLFGTKISELFNLIAEGPDYQVDTSFDNGVFLGLVWDFLVDDSITSKRDDLNGLSAQLDFRWKRPEILGPDWGPMRFTATLTYRWDERFNTSIFALPIRGHFSVGDLRVRGELTYVTGNTRELAAGFSALTNSAVSDQDVRLLASRVEADYKVGPLTFELEWGFADGDEDPRSTTRLTTTSWPRDTNLGLLMFEHTLAFQSARSAAVGIENLRQLDAESFPLTEVATDGRVTNVNALFPQVFYDPTPELRFKLGVLFAWSATDVVDPVQTLLRFDGTDIRDDAVNYNGGKPGKYWGTELDLGVEWRYRDFFEAALEFGYLAPGDAFQDENGDAVSSWMLESRFTFRL